MSEPLLKHDRLPPQDALQDAHTYPTLKTQAWLVFWRPSAETPTTSRNPLVHDPATGVPLANAHARDLLHAIALG
eukprot:9482247-Pyramimonas_sp.AAC.1